MNDPSLRPKKLPLSKLKPYAHNAKKHTEKQIEAIASSIETFGLNQPVEVWQNPEGEYEIVTGHGLVEALKHLGRDEAPCVVLDHLDDDQRRAFCHVDNQLNQMTGSDTAVLYEEMDALDFDWEEFGFDVEDFSDEKYTQIVDSPQYEPDTENVPSTPDCCDTSKTQSLLSDIEKADIPDDMKALLSEAAHRHTVFNYSKIADLYASSPKEVQTLMEDSGLVIIDYNDAIAKGFSSLKAQAESV